MGAVNVLAMVGNFVLSSCAISSDESILDTSSSRAISSSLPLGVIPIPPATDTSCSKDVIAQKLELEAWHDIIQSLSCNQWQ
jgi:hypothetical protein